MPGVAPCSPRKSRAPERVGVSSVESLVKMSLSLGGLVVLILGVLSVERFSLLGEVGVSGSGQTKGWLTDCHVECVHLVRFSPSVMHPSYALTLSLYGSSVRRTKSTPWMFSMLRQCESMTRLLFAGW